MGGSGLRRFLFRCGSSEVCVLEIQPSDQVETVWPWFWCGSCEDQFSVFLLVCSVTGLLGSVGFEPENKTTDSSETWNLWLNWERSSHWACLSPGVFSVSSWTDDSVGSSSGLLHVPMSFSIWDPVQVWLAAQTFLFLCACVGFLKHSQPVCLFHSRFFHCVDPNRKFHRYWRSKVRLDLSLSPIHSQSLSNLQLRYNSLLLSAEIYVLRKRNALREQILFLMIPRIKNKH